MGGTLTEEAFAEQLRTFEHTAFRLELQPVYREGAEEDAFAKFLAGAVEPPTEVAAMRQWFAQVSQLTAQGKRIERVRVQDDPPTEYQRWERWVGEWNIAAGESICYLTREQAHAVGLLPAVGDHDWWLLDSSRLIVMSFDGGGHRTRTEMVTDPGTVVQACAWRDLAVHYAVPGESRKAAP